MRRRRKTKILATLGPATSSQERIRALFDAGADVFRINMSHTSHSALGELHRAVRALEVEVGRPIGILVDLQGPKIRLGTLAGGKRMLKEGERVRLVRKVGAEHDGDIPIPHAEVFSAIKTRHTLLIDDGKVRLRLLSVSENSAEAVVVVGGELKDRKGVNLPDTILPIAAMTPKDRSDLDAALNLGVDWVALSFVQRPEDVAELKKVVSGRAAVLAKIEKPKALDRLSDILEMADALMVARGDLGVELPLEAVPGRQKQIIRTARKAGKPVIVATQMLESMIGSPVPTRAEVSDVATAIYDGADAIMLSAESAAGAWPEESVSMMDRIAIAVENDPGYKARLHFTETFPDPTTADALSEAAKEIAETISASAIICFTNSGASARRIARDRPSVPMLVLTPNEATARRVGLLWGAHAVITKDVSNFEEMVAKSKRMAMRHGLAGSGDKIIIMAGVPFGTPGSTNMLHVQRLTGKELEGFDD